MATQTIDKTEVLKRLRLFNEKADELRSYTFIGKAFHQDAGVSIHFDFEKKTVETKRVGADKEAKAAMCLVLRFFLQPRDRISLHDIAELYRDLPIKDEDKYWVSENMNGLDTFLDKSTELAVNGNPITHRVVLETFLYGDHAHANEDKRKRFEEWKENAAIFTVLENFFEYAVGQVMRHIFWMKAMNVETIKSLEQTYPTS